MRNGSASTRCEKNEVVQAIYPEIEKSRKECRLGSICAWLLAVSIVFGGVSILSACGASADVPVADAVVSASDETEKKETEKNEAEPEIEFEFNGQYISTKVTSLDLRDSGVTDISPLAQCENLEYLDMRGNDIAQEEIFALQEMLPECRIIWTVDICGTLVDSNVERFDARGYTAEEYEELAAQLSQLPKLSTIDMSGILLDAQTLSVFEASVPDAFVLCNVTLGQQIFSSGVAELYLEFKSITDIEILRYCKRLTTLSLMGNDISDIEPLGNLEKLYNLDISFNDSIKSVEPLANCQNLGYLHFLTDSEIDLSPLAKIDSLEYLSIAGDDFSKLPELPNVECLMLQPLGSIASRSGIDFDLALVNEKFENLTHFDIFGYYNVDIAQFRNLPNLNYLSIATCDGFSDLSGLSELSELRTLLILNEKAEMLSSLSSVTQLETLRIENIYDSCGDLSSIKDLSNLSRLDIFNCSIESFEGLRGLSSLTEINIYWSGIVQIESLAELENLRTLSFTDVQMTEEQRQNLREMMPDCNISFS